MVVLAVLVSLIFFLNKVLVLVGKKSGWLVGSVAATLAVIYFLFLDLYIFTILEVGLAVLMGYGFLMKEKKNPNTEKLIQFFIIVVMSLLAYLAFSGIMTIIEFSGAILMLLGTYYLTHNRLALGWFLYGVSHLFAAYVTILKNQQFFADFQIASAIISAVAFVLEREKK